MFWSRAGRTHAPYEYVNNYDRLTAFCRGHFNRPSTYVPTYANFVVPLPLEEWAQGQLARPRPARPRSLCVIGPSRLGKTEWARSLGPHWYFNTLFTPDNMTGLAEYAVMDDIDCKFFPNYKGWFGAQKEFSVTGRYRATKTIGWGNPIIWCCNEDPRWDAKSGWDNDWLEANCDFVVIDKPLF